MRTVIAIWLVIAAAIGCDRSDNHNAYVAHIAPEHREIAKRLSHAGAGVLVDGQGHIHAVMLEEDTEIRVNDSDIAELVTACPMLDQIHLVGASRLTEAAFQQLGRLRNLRVLGVSVAKGDSLNSLSGLVNLERLTLCVESVSEESLRHLPTLPSLKTLELQVPKELSGGFKYLVRLPNLETLEVLEFSIKRELVLEMPALPKLRVLSLPSVDFMDRDVGVLCQYRTLEDVSILGTHLTSKGLEHLLHLPSIERIRIFTSARDAYSEALESENAEFAIQLDAEVGGYSLWSATRIHGQRE